MENNGENDDKNVPNSVNEENSPKNVETTTNLVPEIFDEIIDGPASGSAEDNAVKENINANVSPSPLKNMDDYENNPPGRIIFGMEKVLHKYPFSFTKNEKGKILSMVMNTESTSDIILNDIIVACGFNEDGTLMVVTTERGCVFAIDFVSKHYIRLDQKLFYGSIITPWREKINHFLIGDKAGVIHLLDIDKSNIINRYSIKNGEDIIAISTPPHTIKRQHIVLVHVRYEVIIFDVEQFSPTNRLLFDKQHFYLKFASFFPQLDQYFQCFNTDAVEVYAGATSNKMRVIHPIKMRDRKMLIQGAAGLSADFVLCHNYTDVGGLFNIPCNVPNFLKGLIIDYCFHPSNGLLCLSTLDGYLLLINTYTLELRHICRLQDFTLRKCVFLLHPKEILICGVTDDTGHIVVLNCLQKDMLLVIPTKKAEKLSISPNGKLLVVLDKTGNLNIWSVCQIYDTLKSHQECLRLLKWSFCQNKPLSCPSRHWKTLLARPEECLNEDIRNLLSRERLLNIVREYSWYPHKYRVLMWCALLQLPYNRSQFFQLLKMGVPPLVKQRANQMQLKNGTLNNALIRIWSCLAHWCPVFAHCKFLPQLIFPFVKLLPRNALVVFEICVTLLTNHFQLWFEFHPLEPKNYLGLCENILQSECPELCDFYASMHVKPEHYAWPLLSTTFSEVLSEDNWRCLWDHILISEPNHLIFIVVAYNIFHRRVIMRLPDKTTILAFFHEQSSVDVIKMLRKAHTIMRKCPKTLHPERYITEFQCIPKKVYPKFLNYPREWLVKHEQDIAAVQKEKQFLDARIRQLELEEMKLMERLQSGLRREEHARRVKKMEKLYRDSLKREEERLACQRQVLTVYQKELRNRKAEVAVQVQESEQRQRALKMEKDLELLMQSIEYERARNDADLYMAEEELRNDELELFVQKSLVATGGCSLRTKYYKDIEKLCNERRELKQQVNELSNIKKPKLSTYNSKRNPQLDTIEERIEEIQREFNEILNS